MDQFPAYVNRGQLADASKAPCYWCGGRGSVEVDGDGYGNAQLEPVEVECVHCEGAGAEY